MQMRGTSDQALAQRLLSMRSDGGYRLGAFVKLNGWRYIFLIALHCLVLAILALVGMWPLFIFILGLVIGVFLRDLGWVRSTRRVWPFTVRVTDWEIVERMAAENPTV
jgi:hypothetical protein